MKQDPKQEQHYGATVWVNPTTEGMRREECLCLNCGRMGTIIAPCPYARNLYALCKDGNIALMVTRCPGWMSKEEGK